MATSPNGPTQALPSVTYRDTLLDLMLTTVSEITGVDRRDLVGTSQRRLPHEARTAIWYVLRVDHHWTFVELGNAFDREHSTARTGVSAAHGRLNAADPDTVYMVAALRAAVVDAVVPLEVMRITETMEKLKHAAHEATAAFDRMATGLIEMIEQIERMDVEARETLRGLDVEASDTRARDR